MDKVTIAIKALHGLVDGVKEEISSMENGFVELENELRRLKDAIETVIDEDLDTKTSAEAAERLSQTCLTSVELITQRMNTLDEEVRKLFLTLYGWLAFCVGGTFIPILYVLIQHL